MWRRGFGQDEYWWDRGIEDVRKDIRQPAVQSVQSAPTPQELLFEAGIVVACMLALATVAQLGLHAFGIAPA